MTFRFFFNYAAALFCFYMAIGAFDCRAFAHLFMAVFTGFMGGILHAGSFAFGCGLVAFAAFFVHSCARHCMVAVFAGNVGYCRMLLVIESNVTVGSLKDNTVRRRGISHCGDKAQNGNNRKNFLQHFRHDFSSIYFLKSD